MNVQVGVDPRSILFSFLILCGLVSSTFAAPKDQRIDIVHIANLRGDHERLARLLTNKDRSREATPTLYLVGTDILGVTAYSDVDGQGIEFAEALVELSEDLQTVFIPGRSDLALAENILRERLAILKKSKAPLVATNYESPLKGVRPSQIVTVAGAKIAVLGLLADDSWLKPHKIINFKAALKSALAELPTNLDGLVLVTNIPLAEQRVLAKTLSTTPFANKVLGIFGADPKENAAEVFGTDEKKFVISQAASASRQLTRLSIYWDETGERDEKFNYEDLPQTTKKRLAPVERLERKLRNLFPARVGDVEESISGPVSVEALFQGTSRLGAFVANAFRSKLLSENLKIDGIVGVYRGGLLGKSWAKGELLDADLIKTFPINSQLQAVKVSGTTLEAIIRQDLARQSSRQASALEWSDNLIISEKGSITINRKRIDPQGTYAIVVDSVLLGGQTTDGRVLVPSMRGKDLFTAKDVQVITPASWKDVNERSAVRDFVTQGLSGHIRDSKVSAELVNTPAVDKNIPVIDARETRFLPLQKAELDRVRTHPFSVVWLKNFPEANKPNDVFVVDTVDESVIGVARVASFGFGNQKDVLKQFEAMTKGKWNEENAGPEDKGKYYGVLLADYKAFAKPVALERISDATDAKQFTLRNRVQPQTLEWLKAKGLVEERSVNQAKLIRDSMKLFGGVSEMLQRLESVKERANADIALAGVYHSFTEPLQRVAIFEVKGSELKSFFQKNDRRLYQQVGIKFDRYRKPVEINGEPIKDRKVYRIVSDYSGAKRNFEKTFTEGGKGFALETIREIATEKALGDLRAIVEASDEAGIGPTSKKKKKADEEEDDRLTMRPIRTRSKEVRKQLYDKGILIYPDGERIDTGSEIEEMPEDILFQRYYTKIVDRLNPYDPKSVDEIQKAVAILAQIEVISRLTPESLQVVRENTTHVQDLLTELGTMSEDLRQLFRNPLITLRLKGYRPTVEEADLLTRYYAAKPTDYEPIFEKFVEFKPMIEVMREKLKVTPQSFFQSPSSTTLQHHDPLQHFPDGQAVHDQNVISMLARRLELEGYEKPVIEAVMLGMLAHDGWSHEPSPSNWFFRQFGLAGSQAVLKGSVDLMTLFFGEFEDFLKQHPHIKKEELDLFAKQFKSLRERIGTIKQRNLRSDIKRMMLASPFLALSDLSPQQETWFIKNLAAYVSVQVVGPKAYRTVQDLLERGVNEFSVREIVRKIIDDEFGGLDGASLNERTLLSRQRKAFTVKGARWIEDKVIDYVLCNAFGPVLEKRFDFSATFVPVIEILKQSLPKIPADEMSIVHKMFITEPTFKQPFGKELGRGGWDVGHAARLRAEMARHIPVICQRIRARGEEKLWLDRYGKYFGETLEQIFDHIHDIAAGHMGAYQLAPELIHRIYVNAGVDSTKLTHKPWTWTDVGGYLYNSESLLHRVIVKSNQADTLEALGYLSIERGSASIPDSDKIRVKREVSLTPKDGFVPVDKIRAQPRGRVFKEFKKESGGTLESQEHLRQWVKVSLKDWRGRDVTKDPRLSEMLWDFTHAVPGEIDAKYAINAPALQKKAENRKKLIEKKRKRSEKEREQDESNKEKVKHFQNVLQALNDKDPEALERLEDEFGIEKGEIKRLMKVRAEPDWIEFIRTRAKLVSRLDSMTETSRASHKAVKSKALSSAELSLRVAPDRVPEIRQNEENTVREVEEELTELRREKEAVYLKQVRELIDDSPRKYGFLENWSSSSQIGFKLASERLGEDIVLAAVKKLKASAGIFDVLYNGNFSFPIFGEDGKQALEGLTLLVNEVTEGRLDSAHSIIRTLRRDPIRVMNFFRRFRVVHLAGIRGVKKMISDAALSPMHVIGAEAVLEEAVDRWGVERIAGFEVPFEMEQKSAKSRAVRVADIVLKPERGATMDKAPVIEVKNYSVRSLFEYLNSSLLPQFKADVSLFSDNIMRLYWVFRGVDRETGHIVKLFEEIMKEAGIPATKIKKWIDEHLIFRGESGYYPHFDGSQLDDLRLEGCRALNEKWYKDHPLLEDQRTQEQLQISKEDFKTELRFNWGLANTEGYDIGADLKKFISDSKVPLDLAFYDLEQEDIVDAIVDAANRLGADKIALVLEGSNFQEIPWKTAADVEEYLQSLPQWKREQFLEEHADGADQMTQAQLDRLKGRNELRLQRLRKLKKAGIDPRLVKNRDQIMHVKVAIRRGEEAFVLTANPTDSDLYGDFDAARRNKLAPANVNGSLKINNKPIVEFLSFELAQLYKGLTTKTSRDLNSATKVFVDKSGNRMTIGFSPFSGQGDIANTIQSVLSGLQIEEIWSENFSLSDARLYGILYPHIAKGAKRHIIVDDHFLKFYSKAWQMSGLQTRDPLGRLVVDRVTRMPLEVKPLQADEYVGTWNGRVDETKGIEAKMHLKMMMFKVKKPGQAQPIYILSFGSGNASRLGMTMNNELWMFYETLDPQLFYNHVTEHFSERTKDRQAFDLRNGIAKAILQSATDSNPKAIIEYLQADDFGRRPIDKIKFDALQDLTAFAQGQMTLKAFVEKLEAGGTKLKTEAQILLALWQTASQTKDISEIANLLDAVMVKDIHIADRESYLRKIFDQEKIREHVNTLAKLVGRSSAELMAFAASKKLNLAPEVRLHLQSEILKLQAREKKRQVFFSPTGAQAAAKATEKSTQCADEMKKLKRKKS